MYTDTVRTHTICRGLAAWHAWVGFELQESARGATDPTSSPALWCPLTGSSHQHPALYSLDRAHDGVFLSCQGSSGRSKGLGPLEISANDPVEGAWSSSGNARRR